MENGAGINYSNNMIDNLHPTDTGYKRMASLWFSSLTYILDSPNDSNFIKSPSALVASIYDDKVQLDW